MIIESLLDQDLYTFTVGQVALRQFSNVNVEYEFKCRNEANWTHEIVSEILQEVDNFCNLRFTQDELDYLKTIRFLKKDYLDFLELYQPNRKHISIELNDTLEIKVNGPWYLTVFFEVPILAIVNEVYFRHQGNVWTAGNWSNGMDNLENKKIVANIQKFPFADFGTRRRIANHWQDTVIKELVDIPTFIGTSNVYFAKKYDIRPIGTMSHQLIMVGQGREDVPLRNSQSSMLQSWVDEYRGDLGIALSDTVGIDAFLEDFDLYFAKLYDGLRHDSGDPFEWARKVIRHYEKLGIDPRTKKLVFSDGLDFLTATQIYTAFKDSAQVSFGIGTNLTNDFNGVTPLQIVMKLTQVNGRPVAKVSDSEGKGMCKDEAFLSYLKKVFNV